MDPCIPLKCSDPYGKWGVSLCTVDGQRFSAGDADEAFTLQAISKAIIYGITLNELGVDVVHQFQGKEPSGRKSNEIVLDHNSEHGHTIESEGNLRAYPFLPDRPFNPLVNSGGLVSSSLILKLINPDVKEMALKYDYLQHIVHVKSRSERHIVLVL